MKINVTLDFSDFYSEFESVGDWAQDEVRRLIKSEIKKDPRWKKYIKDQADNAIEDAIKD